MLLAAVLAALAPVAASAPQEHAFPAARAKEPTPLLGLRWNDAKKRQELVHVDPVTLRPRAKPALGVGTFGTRWAYSRDRERLAIATQFQSRRGVVASLQVLDPHTFRRQMALPFANSELWAVSWPEPDRLLAVRRASYPARTEVVSVAPSARRVVARAELDGDIMGMQPTRDGLALLLAPTRRIGAATLAVVSANAEIRSVALERVWIGFEAPETHTDEAVGRQRGAGFTVDDTGARAFVFPAGSDAAEIDLRTLAVTYHALTEPVSPLERLRRFLDPQARAKATEGPWRAARWLGGGLVAVTGTDHSTWKDADSRLQMRSSPAGLTLVDTKTWRARTIDRGAAWFQLAEGLILATGSTYDSTVRAQTGMGLAAYDFAGQRRFRLFEGRPVHVGQVFRGRAYVGEADERMRVVDLASGTVVGTRVTPPPWLLLDDAAPF